MTPEEIGNRMQDIARGAGDFIWNERNKVTVEDVETKSLNSLVSYVDTSAERLIVEGLGELLPEAGFITEEQTITGKGERFNWIIDPLDGTTNFLHGIPTYAVSLALQDGDDIVAGVVYEVGQREMFSAVKGQGAFLNGRKIRVSPTLDLNNSLMATGFPYYDFGRMQNFLKLINELFQKTRGVRRIGSAATDLAYVACGRFEGFFEYGLSPWDVAAGALLVQEAGGQVSDYKGSDKYLYGGEILAATPGLFDDLLAIIQKHM